MSRKKTADNLFQRGDTWYIRYNANGEKIIRSLKTKSLREAKRLRDQILGHRSIAAQFGIEPPKPKKDPTFAEINALWLQSRQAGGDLRDNSIELYDRWSRLWIAPFFGNRLMSTITVDDIERFLAHLRESKGRVTKRPLSRDTVAGIFTALRAMYRQAIKRRWYTGPNPLDQLDRTPRRNASRDVTLTEDEARAFIGHLSGALYYKVGLALYTGLRWGEVHGLEWQGDIELDTDPPTLTVRRSFRGPPKNEASAATIPLAADAVTLLRRWRREQGIGARYVFPDRRGDIRRATYRHECELIHGAATNAGIAKNITPHVFRHTFGTWMYERTGDPKVVQRLMRHASFRTSMMYVHDRRELGEVVNRLPTITEPHLKAV